MRVPAIPSGRPQPRLSKLVAQQAVEASASDKFVFWDLQNTPLPAELCTLPSVVLETLCHGLDATRFTVVTEVPASTELGAELLRALKTTAGVQLLTFLRTAPQAAGSTAAEYELKRVSSPSPSPGMVARKCHDSAGSSCVTCQHVLKASGKRLPGERACDQWPDLAVLLVGISLVPLWG